MLFINNDITNVIIKDTLYKDKPFIFYNNIFIKTYVQK